MAEKKPLTPEEIEALIAKAAEVDALREAATAAEAKSKILEAQIKEAAQKGAVAAIPVIGKFKAAWENAEGRKGERSVEFADGHTRVRMGSKVVGSAELIKLANKGKLSEKELKAWPEMAEIEQNDAIAFLCKLAAINYGGLKPVTKKK